MPELLTDRLQELARAGAPGFPVLSLYLNTEPDGTGRTRHELFLRKELRERAATYAERSAERESVDADIERVERYVANELQPSTRGLAIFACHAAGLFEALQLEVPFDRHELVIGDQPHLYPLARLDEAHPRYAAVVLDTNLARIVVFGTGRAVNAAEVRSEKTKGTKAGGWAQARLQRHIDHKRLQHIKEVVERLETVVRADRVDHLVLAGDEVAVPLLREHLPEPLQKKVVDSVRLDIRSPEHEILETTLGAMRRKDEETDENVVKAMVDDFRAGGLAVLGSERVLKALELGQAHTLVMTARPAGIEGGEAAANELVIRAGQTGVPVRFIENPDLLAPFGGVGATLRFLL